MVKVGIIGGSGLEDPKFLKDQREVEYETPYGKPSSPLMVGKISGVEVVILSRHGKGHTIMPTNVPYQANIYALKEAGCTHILATTACGSLREEIKPGELVFIDQFIDRTTKRRSTFYEKDLVCHIPMAEPFCPNLRRLLYEQARKLGFRCHERGTVVTIEGPRFSSRAESLMFRQWGGDVINMTTVPEVVLAREAGLHMLLLLCRRIMTVGNKPRRQWIYRWFLKLSSGTLRRFRSYCLQRSLKLEITMIVPARGISNQQSSQNNSCMNLRSARSISFMKKFRYMN